VVDVNLTGQVYGAMAALLHIKREGRGALIHVSSLEAKHSFPFHTAYAAAKHGIDGFLETLRVELKHEGLPISVTQVLPGTINTPLFVGVAPSSVSSLLACRRSTNLTSSQTSSSTPPSIRPATWSPGALRRR
jgi:NAD(P)-dependent dehydrogenase (short-subunit alcohol dehydrogenase family)